MFKKKEVRTVPYAKVGEIHHGVNSIDLKIVSSLGRVIPHVIEANAEQGWFIRFKTDEEGKFVKLPGSNAEFDTEFIENTEFTIVVNDK